MPVYHYKNADKSSAFVVVKKDNSNIILTLP